MNRKNLAVLLFLLFGTGCAGGQTSGIRNDKQPQITSSKEVEKLQKEPRFIDLMKRMNFE